jgi:hypothetical protein
VFTALRSINELKTTVVSLIACANEATCDGLAQEIIDRPDCGSLIPGRDLEGRGEPSLLAQAINRCHNSRERASAVFVVTNDQVAHYYKTQADYHYVILRCTYLGLIA